MYITALAGEVLLTTFVIQYDIIIIKYGIINVLGREQNLHYLPGTGNRLSRNSIYTLTAESYIIEYIMSN